MKFPTWKNGCASRTLKVSRVGHGILIKPPQFKCARTDPSQYLFQPWAYQPDTERFSISVSDYWFPKTVIGRWPPLRLKRAIRELKLGKRDSLSDTGNKSPSLELSIIKSAACTACASRLFPPRSSRFVPNPARSYTKVDRPLDTITLGHRALEYFQIVSVAAVVPQLRVSIVS